MPIYEYHCKRCDKTFEALVASSRAKPKIECEHCGGAEVEKLFSTFAPQSGGKPEMPPCQGGCAGGFERGACGAGTCGLQ